MVTKLKEVDVVTVGVGLTGTMLAKELTLAGLTVVGLERGPDRKPQEEYVLPRIRDDAMLIEVEVNAEQGALLVIGNTYYPGWRATVDGVPAQIHSVDGAMQGVWMPSRENRVVLRYAHWPSRVGFGLQFFALAVCGLVLVRDRAARIHA